MPPTPPDPFRRATPPPATIFAAPPHSGPWASLWADQNKQMAKQRAIAFAAAHPYPGYVSPADLQAEAQRRLDAVYGPIMQALQMQQQQAHDRSLADAASWKSIGDILGQQGGMETAQNMAQAQREDQKAESEIAWQQAQALSERAGKQFDLLDELKKEQAGLQSDYVKPIQTFKFGNTIVGLYSDGSIKPLFTGPDKQNLVPQKLANGQIVWFNRDTGEPVSDPYGPTKTSKPKSWQSTTLGGKSVLYNPNDATYHDPITKERITEMPQGTSEPDLTKSIALRQWVDKNLKPIPGLAGVPVPPRWKPDTQSGGGGQASKTDISWGWSTIRDSFYHPLRNNNRPYTQKELNTILVRANNARTRAWNALPDAEKKKAIAGGAPADGPRPIRLGDLPRMSDEQRQRLGIGGGSQDPQSVYMALIQHGIPARQAWTMVRRYYKGFGQDYFSGKDKAAAETAATDVSKWVHVPAGVDRPGVPTHQGILEFAARVAQVWGSPLTVGTGTNHNQYVKGEGNTQSAHWTGWAVDIPMQGANLTRLGQDALIAAGMPEAQARKVTHWDGGDYNGYNILFNTSKGGNHYNHLHIGLRPSRQQDPAQPISTSTGIPTPDSARSPEGARTAAQVMAKGFGWSGNEWLALDQLWHNESHWDYKIHNYEGSGAVGIPQYMPSAHGAPPGDFLTNPITQIRWGLNYIKSRYKTPSRAWAFWQATVHRNASMAPPDLRRAAATWISHGWAGY